uniref:Uncharacterized protein n=1 Tax=Romanomermis culicivorax TaxID=13658 RepID=A0A915I8H6_ROMCU
MTVFNLRSLHVRIKFGLKHLEITLTINIVLEKKLDLLGCGRQLQPKLLSLENIVNDYGGFKQFCIASWEFIKSLPDLLQNPIQYLQRQQAEDAAKVVNKALEIMEKNTMIQNTTK